MRSVLLKGVDAKGTAYYELSGTDDERVEGVIRDVLSSGVWRVASRRERLWHALTRSRFSWVEFALLTLAANVAVALLRGWGWL